MTTMSRHHRGYTLLELAATTVLISLVALVSYAFIASSAGTSAAQSAHLELSAVVAAEQVFASVNGRFTPAPSQLTTVGRTISITSSNSTGESVVSIAVSDQDTLAVAVLASNGTCYVTTVTSLTIGGVATNLVGTSPCTAAAHLPAGEAPLSDDPV